MHDALGLDLGAPSLAPVVNRGDVDAPDRSGEARTRAPAIPHPRTVDLTWPAPGTPLLELVGDPLADPPTATHGSASADVAALVAAAIADTTEDGDDAPAVVVVAHPCPWGPFRTGLLRAALDRVGLTAVHLVPDAIAVVEHAGPALPAAAGTVAVLHVREDGVTVSVVHRRPDAPASLVGSPCTVPDLGTGDVPDAVLAHVRGVVAAGLPGTEDGEDDDGDAWRRAALALRRDCERAGEELLSGRAATVAAGPLHPGREVRMVPSELDARLRPRAQRAAARAAAAVVADAALGVDAVLLTGRLAAPLLSEVVGTRFDAPVVVVPDGDRSAALGAAALGHSLHGRGATVPASPGQTASRRARWGRGRRGRARAARAAALAGTGVVLLAVLALAGAQDAFADPMPAGAPVWVTPRATPPPTPPAAG